MSDIGLRAAEAVRKMVELRKTNVRAECCKIGATSHTFYNWECGDNDPGAYFIAMMLKEGYDINYILLGGKHDNR